MRSCVLIALGVIATCAGSQATEAQVTLDINEILHTSINTNLLADGDFSCQLRTPNGLTIQFRPENEGNPEKYTLRPFNSINGCAVDIKITDKTDEGIWELSFTPKSGGEGGSRRYEVAVNPAETVTEPTVDRVIENLNEEFIDTSVGENHRIVIRKFDFVMTESCHLKSPEGDVYDLNDVNITGIHVIKDNEVACGVDISISEEFAGKWTLFSRDTRHSIPIERRLNFTIYIEEIVKASPEEITIRQGSNLFIRLADPTILYDTCKLVEPDHSLEVSYQVDENHLEECGFIVPNVQVNYTGTWHIVVGNRIIYKAPVKVTVNELSNEEEIVETSLVWERDRPVDIQVGPENAIYCRIADPTEHVVFEGFGRCQISLNRAGSQHNGVWRMLVGEPGRVLTEERTLTVTVREAARRPRVITRVEKQRPEVLLTCALEGEHTISSCKFREPSGRVLLATEGVGEDRYSFHGVGVSLESSVQTTSCGLRITNPLYEDMGLWRCTMETDDNELYYGFLTVLCPFATSQPGAPPVETNPILTAAHSTVEGVEDEAVTMSCSLQSAIRYCYFRARNGTVFNVSPETKSDMFEYSGLGFDAGECGIRFRSLQARDTGAWSCHVGLPGVSQEQRSSFSVNIQRQIYTFQRSESNGLVVTGQVYDERAVEYCRFVRIDGLGFTTENVPDGYKDASSLSAGLCSIVVASPTMLDNHPWTVAARILGQDGEVSDQTDHSIEMPEPEDETETHPRPPPPPGQIRVVGMSQTVVWVLIALLSLSLTVMVVNSVTSRPRHWASTKFSSFRSSIRKQPSQAPPPYTTAANVA